MENPSSGQSATSQSTSVSLQTALQSDAGHRLPRMMRRVAVKFAEGTTPEQIATEEVMTVSTVKELIGYAAFTLNCEPPMFSKGRAPLSDKNSNLGAGRQDLNATQFMTKTKCIICRRHLDEDSERVAVTAVLLNYEMDERNWGDHKIAPYLLDMPACYCLDCVHSVEEFRIHNPLFVSVEEREELAKWKQEQSRLEQEKIASKDRDLTASLAAGDTHDFNKAMPTSAPLTDSMGHAAPMSRLIAGIADSGDKADVEAAIVGDLPSHSPLFKLVASAASKIAPGGAPGSGDAIQRAKLLTYLNSPTSRGKLRPQAREAAKLWIDGVSQSKIAEKLRVDQSTVSRLINAAKKEANAVK